MEDNWRVRCEPRVELPRQQQRRKRKSDPDPLEQLGSHAVRSKEQIDALERMLQSAMPPRVVLENTFIGLRNSVAEELEEQWRRGVEHAECVASARVAEIEAQLLQPDSDDFTKFLESLPRSPDSTIDLEALAREVDLLVA
jgi:hypothetical protein